MINHGTTGGYYAHRRHNEAPCDACREAVNAYLRKYRASKGKARTRERDAIRRKALSRLRKIHHAEYMKIVREIEDELIDESESWFDEQEGQ